MLRALGILPSLADDLDSTPITSIPSRSFAKISIPTEIPLVQVRMVMKDDWQSLLPE